MARALPAGLLAVALLAASSIAGPAGVILPAGARVRTPSAPPPTRAVACTEDPFGAGFGDWADARWPGHHLTAAVYDTRTRCEYRYRGDRRVTTASVLKAEILAGVVLRAQREERALTERERSLAGPMIRTSDDPSANALWTSLGGTSAMASLERSLWLVETTARSPWGLTSSSAHDRNRLLRLLLRGEGGTFTATSRATARGFLLDVAPTQRWGVTAGVPTGWAVPMKNGFYPAGCCGWRVNTSGLVERPDGSAYVLTVMSDGWPSLEAGIPAVEEFARTAAAWNLTAVGPHRSGARFARALRRDVLGAGASWSAEREIALRIGADAGRAGTEAARLLGDASLDATSGAYLRLHLGALHRWPSPGTWSGRMAQLRSGERSLLAVADAIASSSEFGGGTPLAGEAYVDRAYQQVLGRAPASADRAWWVARIERTGHPGELLLGLTGSATYRWASGRAVQIATAHLTLLRRLPTTDEQATWADRLWAGETGADLAGALIGSEAYRTRFT